MEADDEISLDFHPLTTPNDNNIIHTLAVDELGMKLVGASIVAGLAWWMKNPNTWGENWDSSDMDGCTLHRRHVEAIHLLGAGNHSRAESGWTLNVDEYG